MAKKLKEYFDTDLAETLADKIWKHERKFPKSKFVKHASNGLEDKELKDRVAHMAQSIYHHMPGEYADKLAVLTKILGPENPGSYGTFNNYFWQWPLSSVVEQFGLEYKSVSIDFIYQLTKRSTGEFAIRGFFEADPHFVLDIFKRWSKDDNFHVRRLTSEGLRPLLPWAKKVTCFVEQPKEVFALLEGLSNDSEKYVLTSVANHMGDMVKLNYESSMAELERWSKAASPNRKWLIKHAVRNLRKKGDQRALMLSDNLS